MRARAREEGEGTVVLMDGNKEGSSRDDFEGSGGEGRWIRVGGKGKSSVAGTTDGSRVTNITLGTEPNDTLAYATGLELDQPIMRNIGGNGGRLERYRE